MTAADLVVVIRPRVRRYVREMRRADAALRRLAASAPWGIDAALQRAQGARRSACGGSGVHESVTGVSRADCPCCRNHGALPGSWVVDVYGRLKTQAVPGEVMLTLCDHCVAAIAFAGADAHPHPLDGFRRAAREAGFPVPPRVYGRQRRGGAA